MSVYSSIQFCATTGEQPSIRIHAEGGYLGLVIAKDDSHITLNLSPEGYRRLARECDAAAAAAEGAREKAA